MWLNCFKTTEREAMTGILSLKRKPIFNHLDFLKKKIVVTKYAQYNDSHPNSLQASRRCIYNKNY